MFSNKWQDNSRGNVFLSHFLCSGQAAVSFPAPPALWRSAISSCSPGASVLRGPGCTAPDSGGGGPCSPLRDSKPGLSPLGPLLSNVRPVFLPWVQSHLTSYSCKNTRSGSFQKGLSWLKHSSRQHLRCHLCIMPEGAAEGQYILHFPAFVCPWKKVEWTRGGDKLSHISICVHTWEQRKK